MLAVADLFLQPVRRGLDVIRRKFTVSVTDSSSSAVWPCKDLGNVGPPSMGRLPA